MKFPEFHNNHQEIIDIAQKEYDLIIRYCDEFVDGEGNVTKNPELGCWGFIWKNGAISYCGLNQNTPEYEQKAKVATALFIYLWTNKEIEASLAEKLSYGYVVAHVV